MKLSRDKRERLTRMLRETVYTWAEIENEDALIPQIETYYGLDDAIIHVVTLKEDLSHSDRFYIKIANSEQ